MVTRNCSDVQIKILSQGKWRRRDRDVIYVLV